MRRITATSDDHALGSIGRDHAVRDVRDRRTCRSPGSAPATASVTAPATGPNTPADSIALLDLPAMPAQASASTAGMTIASRRRGPTPDQHVLRTRSKRCSRTTAPTRPRRWRLRSRCASRDATPPRGPAEAPPRRSSHRAVPCARAKYARQERRASANGARREGNLFTKMGSFFRRGQPSTTWQRKPARPLLPSLSRCSRRARASGRANGWRSHARSRHRRRGVAAVPAGRPAVSGHADQDRVLRSGQTGIRGPRARSGRAGRDRARAWACADELPRRA